MLTNNSYTEQHLMNVLELEEHVNRWSKQQEKETPNHALMILVSYLEAETVKYLTNL